MIRVKICGITTYDDALACAQAGANMLGFNFFKRSPRYIEPAAATGICDRLRAQLGDACPVLVGIFANDTANTIANTMSDVGLDAAQLSGDESDGVLKQLRGRAYKAIRPMNQAMAKEDVKYFASVFPTNEKLPSLLLDAYHPDLYGGTGEQASQDVIAAIKADVPRLMLAGGLNPDNVAARISSVQPWGVDVASGVEPENQPGVKDHARVKAFIEAARSAQVG